MGLGLWVLMAAVFGGFYVYVNPEVLDQKPLSITEKIDSILENSTNESELVDKLNITEVIDDETDEVVEVVAPEGVVSLGRPQRLEEFRCRYDSDCGDFFSEFSSDSLFCSRVSGNCYMK